MQLYFFSLFHSPLHNFKYLVDMKSVFYKFIQPCTGDQRLCIMNTVEQIILPVTVKFRQHIIEQQNRCIMNVPTEMWRILNGCAHLHRSR